VHAGAGEGIIAGKSGGIISRYASHCWALSLMDVFTCRRRARKLDDNVTVAHCAGAQGYDVLVAEIWPWVDAGVYSFIPLVVIISLNSLIVRHVVGARRMRRHLASFRSTTPVDRRRTAAAAAADATESLGSRQRQATAGRCAMYGA